MRRWGIKNSLGSAVKTDFRQAGALCVESEASTDSPASGLARQAKLPVRIGFPICGTANRFRRAIERAYAGYG